MSVPSNGIDESTLIDWETSYSANGYSFFPQSPDSSNAYMIQSIGFSLLQIWEIDLAPEADQTFKVIGVIESKDPQVLDFHLNKETGYGMIFTYKDYEGRCEDTSYGATDFEGQGCNSYGSINSNVFSKSCDLNGDCSNINNTFIPC